MYNEDSLPAKQLLTNPNSLLKKFYTRRHSLESQSDPTDPTHEIRKQKLLKQKLTSDYVRLLKENNYLREFIKIHHLKIKGAKISSNLDTLSSNKKTGTLSYELDLLESKISKIFTYF